MRTMHLVKALTDFELKEMERELSDGKRQNLLQLFRYLKKFRAEEKAPSVSEILKKVFAQKHTKPNELQLRNKLSRLNEILYQYLATTEFKTQMANNRHLLNQWLVTAFRNRKMPLAKTDIDGFIKTAIDNFMLDEAAPMMRLRALIGGNSFEKNLKDITDWQQLEQKRLLLHYAVAESTKATSFENESNRLQNRPNVWKQYKTPDYTFNFKELKNDWYFRLFENSRLSTLNINAKSKILFLKKAEEAINESNTKHMLTRGVRENLLLNIALLLMNQGLFDEALEYHQKHFEQTKANGIQPHPVAFVNYMVNLMQLERLKEAKEVYLENRRAIDASPFAMPAHFMYSSACLFTNEEKKAISVLTDITPQLDHEKLTVRNLYLTSFIIRKEFSLAQTEAVNLKRAIAGYERNGYIQQLQAATLVLIDFANAKKQGDPLNKKLLAKTHKNALSALQNLNDDPVHCLILKWLIKQI